MKRHSFFSASTNRVEGGVSSLYPPAGRPSPSGDKFLMGGPAIIKKAAVFAASAFLCVSLSPCRPDAAQADIPAAREAGSSQEDASGEAPGYDEVDIDLTVMSKTMVYAEVTNILLKPEKYIGKTIKMKGPVVTYKTKNTDSSPRYDFAVIIEDATACCQKGMEFELYGVTREPDNYPEDDTRITVAGTFESYDAGRYVYYHVANAQILS